MSIRCMMAAAVRLLVVVSCVFTSPLVRAQPSAEPVLALVVDSDAVPLASLSAALEAELDVAVTAAESARDVIPTVRVLRLPSGNVEVSLSSRSLPRASREVALEGTPEEQTETVALIAANLVRNEAAALLQDLRPQPVPAAPAASAAPASVEAPKPARLRSPCSLDERLTFGVDLAPFVGTSSVAEGRTAARAVSLGLLGTYSARLKGLELSAGVNIKRLSVCGVQLAAGANIALGPVRGAQLAEFNLAMESLVGVQLGTANLTVGAVRGAQLGTLNVATGKLVGAQLGVVTAAGAGAQGLQAGVLNVNLGLTHGFQGGIANFARGVEGFQGALLNLNVGALHGTQLGVVNITTDEVHGVQLGVINYAERSDASIGMLSIVRRGRTSIDATTSIESGVNLLGITHGGKYVHNVFGIGARAGRDDNGARLAVMYGIGVRVLSLGRFRVDVDAMAVRLLRKDAYSKNTVLPTVRVPVTFNVYRGLGLMLVPSYQVMITDDPEEAPQSLWGQQTFQEGTRRVFGFPGLSLGARWEFDHGLRDEATAGAGDARARR